MYINSLISFKKSQFFSAKFDAYFIYEYAALTGRRPKLQFKANDLLSFKWNKVQLKDSFQFMKSSLAKLPSILGLNNVQKGFYAWRLADHERNLDYMGKMPSKYDFGFDRMLKEQQAEFLQWYTPRELDTNFVYNMKAEAIKYCK